MRVGHGAKRRGRRHTGARGQSGQRGCLQAGHVRRRGVGPEGLQSMETLKGAVFRPFLETRSEDLRDFLRTEGLSWVEDPSNQETSYLRNWIRHHWLSQLEAKRPGAVKRLGHSLENLSRSKPDAKVQGTSLSRLEYEALSSRDQIRVLAQLLKNSQFMSFSLSQLKEIQKRLGKQQTRHIFEVAGVRWIVNAGRISLRENQEK